MSYCLNPKCLNPSDPKNNDQLFCTNCGWELVFQQRYRVTQPLGVGGCGDVFEVDDNGTLKVLKRLNPKYKYSKIISLFQQEARVLNKLKHPGIPKVEKDGYFQYQAEGNKNPIHCLVMEKIEGVNLDKWMEIRENKPIGEEDAIAWLLQLIDILEKLHQNQYFHRDIKPSNIMLKPDGKLVLIDFGAVREITDTYLAKLGTNRELTSVQTFGYTPIEQINGQPLPQSDFFALGRTFVHLLTGKELEEFEEDKESKLLWRDSATHISKPLADLIDWLMEPLARKRPPNAKIINECLKELQSGNLNFSLPIVQNLHKEPEILEELLPVTKIDRKPRWRGWQIVMFSSVLATSLVMGARYMGWLEKWELPAFDWLMRMRPAEPIDPRLVVVEITKEDTDKNYPLKDYQITELIQKIQHHKPRTIGLDLHRYEERPPGRQELIKLFQQNPHFFIVCSFNGDGKNYDSPPEFSAKQLTEQVGYSNLEQDDKIDNVIRRHLLSYNPTFSSSPGCQTPNSFSLQLASHLLAAEKKPLKLNANRTWYSEKTIFKRLANRTGGYQKLGESNQILINYRANDRPAYKFTLTQILTDKVSPNLIKDKIVLIGYNAPVANDEHDTSLGRMPGVWIHTHQTSQILSAVIDKRPLLWVLPQWRDFQWGDSIFVAVWSFIGALIGWGFRSTVKLTLLNVMFALVLYQICLIIMIQGGWIPFIPSVLTLFSTTAFVVYIKLKTSKQA
ncbi:MAG TPA: CHASE2 domain-containing protein [Leptolyngbyaceae cyanobacterium]